MKKAILLFALAALVGVAQEKKTQPAPIEGGVEKLFTIKYADVYALRNLFANFGAQVNADPTMRVLAVHGRPETVAAIEEAIKRLDVPGVEKNIELTGYILLASAQPGQYAEPADLEPVVKQLRALFPYKSYRVLDVISLRARDGGSGNTDGQLSTLPGSPADFKPGYNFRFDRSTVAATDAVRVVRFQNLMLHVGVAPGRATMIRTDVDVREGQKIVVGKASVNGAEEALVLVLSAKIVD
jgi:hypothetical protein